MSLEKGIKSGKEHRQKYYDSRSFDLTCRHQGGCRACKQNRQYNNTKRIIAVKEREKDEY